MWTINKVHRIYLEAARDISQQKEEYIKKPLLVSGALALLCVACLCLIFIHLTYPLHLAVYVRCVEYSSYVCLKVKNILPVDEVCPYNIS